MLLILFETFIVRLMSVSFVHVYMFLSNSLFIALLQETQDLGWCIFFVEVFWDYWPSMHIQIDIIILDNHFGLE